jgi:hypothetical protein
MNLKLDQAKEIIRNAFQPLRCGVEDFDYEQKVKFRIFDEKDQPVLRMDDVKASIVCDSAKLKELLFEVRERLERKGLALNPWQFPVP